MEFDINRVYTCVNADELKIGSKVLAADSLFDLKAFVENDCNSTELLRVLATDYKNRFIILNDNVIDEAFNLAYLISEPEEKKLKWTDLKIGDVIRNKELPFIKYLITGIDEGAGQVFFCGSWTKGDELEEWEKVEENRSVEE